MAFSTRNDQSISYSMWIVNIVGTGTFFGVFFCRRFSRQRPQVLMSSRRRPAVGWGRLGVGLGILTLTNNPSWNKETVRGSHNTWRFHCGISVSSLRMVCFLHAAHRPPEIVVPLKCPSYQVPQGIHIYIYVGLHIYICRKRYKWSTATIPETVSRRVKPHLSVIYFMQQ